MDETSGLQNFFSSAQIEFLAEDEEMTIIPNFSLPSISLSNNIGYGPFKPMTPTTVPLWLAITLKQIHKCSIRPPFWLSIEYLKAKLQEEQIENKADLSSIPQHYFEISKLLLETASDDIEGAEEIHALITSIWEIRSDKIRHSMVEIVNYPNAVSLSSMSAIEINAIRPIFMKSLDQFYELRPEAEKQIATAVPIIPPVSNQPTTQVRNLRTHRPLN